MRRCLAWTLIELLVVLAVFGILLGAFVWTSLRGPSAAGVAQELARIVALARWSAVQEGAARTLLASAGGELAVAPGYACSSAAPGARPSWSPPPRTLVDWPVMGLAFAPDGRPRRCDGSAVGNATIPVEGPRGDRAAVIVASLGRVRWERR
jgi:prepilin-type N-terminal cleavage/methylation domain-containing protein